MTKQLEFEFMEEGRHKRIDSEKISKYLMPIPITSSFYLVGSIISEHIQTNYPETYDSVMQVISKLF